MIYTDLKAKQNRTLKLLRQKMTSQNNFSRKICKSFYFNIPDT